MSINGLDARPAQLKLPTDAVEDAEAEDAEAAYELYDAKLAAKLRDLYAQLETETTAVAQLRRDAPPQAAQLYLDHLRSEIAQHDADWPTRRAELLQRAAAQRKNGLENVKVDRHENVKLAWDGANTDLDRLRAVTEAVAVLERAKAAALEVGVLR